MNPKNKLYEDLLSSIRPSVTPPDGVDLSEDRLSKLATQNQLLQALSPYMSASQEADFKRSILEQMLGDGTGNPDDFFKQEYTPEEPKGRSLKDFLETLK